MAGPDQPERSDAIAEAAEIRQYRAWLVAEVASGAMALDGICEQHDTEPYCAMVKVVVVAEKVPGVGKVRARRAMGELGISEDARWGEVDRETLRELWAAMASGASRPVRGAG